MNKHILTAGMMFTLLLTGCSDERMGGPATDADEVGIINLAGEIEQLAVSRVNDDGFADGDIMGVYVVDYEGTLPGTLRADGNRGGHYRHGYRRPSVCRAVSPRNQRRRHP